MKLTKEHRKAFYALLFPALIERILASLFHTVDSMMLGQMKTDSTLAVAAVGFCGSPSNLIISVTTAFFIGTTATVAWHKGAQQPSKMRNIAYQSFSLSLGISTIFTLVGFFGAEVIIGFVCKGSEAFDLAVTYYRINTIGFFFQIITACITAMYRGVGITKLPMIYNITGSIVNVVLNYLLIFGKLGFPAMGVSGAAWATSISKIVAFAIGLISLFVKKSPLRYQKGLCLKPDRAFFARLLPISLTASAEQVIAQFGAVLTTKIISGLPTDQIAANQICANVENFAWSSGSACNAASTSLFGQSMGAQNEKQGRAYLRLTLYWAIGFAAVEMLLLCCFGREIAVLFSNNEALYPLLVRMFITTAMSLPFINCHFSISGALRGAGDTIAPLLSSMMSLWIFRVAGGFLLIHVLGWSIEAFRWCMVLDQGFRCAAVSVFFLTGHWKRHLQGNKKSSR